MKKIPLAPAVRMSTRFAIRLLVQAAILAAFTTANLAGHAAAARSSTKSIIVLADRYVVAGRAWDNLDALEKHVIASKTARLQLLTCGPGTTRSLKAVVHRFRSLPIDIYPLDADNRACSSVVRIPVAERQPPGERPLGIDDAAVERYWHEIEP